MSRFFDAGQEAHGFIAVGQLATGVIAIGQSALGVIAIGQLSRGVVAVGQLSFGVFSVGMGSVGIFGTIAMGGVAGRRGLGFVLELIPRLKRRRVPPATTSARDVWSTGEAGWVRGQLVRDPNGNAALFDGDRPMQVKLMRALRAPAESALGGDVLAYTVRSGEVLVCERLMSTTAPTLAENLRLITWALRFGVLALIAAAYWIVVLFPLIRALVEMG